MSICPNVSSKEWKNLVDAHGEDGAYKKWLQNGKEIPGVANVAMGNSAVLIKNLQKKVDATVSINPDLDVTAKLVKDKEQTRIEINPSLLQGDNEIHEFGHVYVDLLGGLDNHIIKAGLNRLKGSNLERELRKKYPEDTSDENTFQKELIAVAIGKDAKSIWKNNPEKADMIEKWTSGFFRNLNRSIGINEQEAKELSENLIEELVNKNKPDTNIEEELYGERNLRAKPAAPTSEKRKALAKEALGIITSKIEIMKRKLDTSNTGQTVVLAELIELQRTLQKHRADSALASFVSLAVNQTNTILEKFEEYAKDGSKGSLRTMQYLHSSMLAFDEELLKAISEDLTEDQKVLDDEISKVRVNQLKIHDAFKKASVSILKEDFGDGLLKKTESFFARKAEMEFNTKDRGSENEEKKQRREEYISKYLEDNRKIIDEKISDKLDKLLTTIEKDIGVVDAFVNNPKDMNSDIIRQVVKMFDKADFEIQEKSVFVARRAEKLYKAYTSYVGKSNNQKELWSSVLEQDNEGNTLPRIARTGSPQWSDIKSPGGKYKGTPVEEMYDFLIDLSVENDSKLPAKAQLKGQLPVMNKNTFERIGSNGIFTAIKEGTLDIFKLRKEDTDSGQLNDDSKEQKDEEVRSSMDDAVKVLSTQAGEEKKIIPVHFRGTIKETDRSYDVLSLMVLDAHQATEYEAKLNLAATVEVTLSMIGEARIIQRSGFLGRIKENLDGSPQKSKGESNTYKVLERLIENRLYGIQTTGDAKTAKMSSKIKQYVSIINLFGNYLSAGANFTQGLAMVFMEGAGKQFYGVKNVMNAEAKYFLDIPSNISDASRHRAKGKTNLLRELFNAQSDWNVLENDFNKNNGLKRNANMGTGLALNSTAEHSVQSIGMYSVLDNIKVKNKDGKYITKEGTVTEKREDAMSLDEAYSVGYQNTKTKKTISQEAYDKLSQNEKKDYMDGVLHLDENVSSTDRTKDKGTFEISQVLRRVNRDLFGNYDPKNKSRIEAHAVGSLFAHMRQWMVPGFLKRYRGGHSLYIRDKQAKLGFRTVRNNELRDVDLSYNVETEEYEEGMYVSTMRWVGMMVQDANRLKFKVMSESWKDLTELEKSNVKRTASEIAMTAAAYITFVVLQAALEDLDDDEEKNQAALVAAFFSRRLVSELMTYTSPAEWSRTFRSPAVTLSLLDNVIKALSQTATSPLEEYSKGDHKGENKALHYWMKVTPLKIIDKDVEDSLKYILRSY